MGRRIASARFEAGYKTTESFAQALSLSAAAIRKWESDRSQPTHDNLARIAEATGKAIGYFYGEEGAETADAIARLEKLIAQAHAEPAGEMIAIPLYDRVTAGTGGVPDATPSEYRHIPRTWIPAGQEEACYLVRSSGDSMEGLGIVEGDLLFVCTAVPVRHGDIAVVRIEDEVVVKRVQELDDSLLLISENPQHPPRRVNGSGVAILGRVMWFRRDV